MNAYIEHTLLKSDATSDEIFKLCHEAISHQFIAVCLNPYWVEYAHSLLKTSDVKLCSVVGFPLGATFSKVKAFETEQLIELGAQEIDMVMNIGALKSANYQAVQKDIEVVVRAAQGKTVKVIIETCLLTDKEKRTACLLCAEAGAHYVKTSTGFSKAGAKVEDIILMRETVGSQIGIKASGGITNRSFALQLIEAGASRIGTSKGTNLIIDSE